MAFGVYIFDPAAADVRAEKHYYSHTLDFFIQKIMDDCWPRVKEKDENRMNKISR